MIFESASQINIIMNHIKKMYSNVSAPIAPAADKNPNRVLGGLRGQGVDHYSVLGEDGVERSVPTQKYVQGLEQKLREQDQQMQSLEKKIRSVSNDQKATATALNTLRKSS